MPKAIDELVRMRDFQTLYELMSEDDDWMTQLDAAEGLARLGDRRGYDFLISSTQSEDSEIRDVAREILDAPDLKRIREEYDAIRLRQHRDRVEAARKRLGRGGPVFRYKMIYLASGEILSEDETPEGFEVSALDELGLQGWEVVNMIPRRRTLLVGSVDDHFTGAYFLLKRTVLPDEPLED
jgi:HEAT repeat protein